MARRLRLQGKRRSNYTLEQQQQPLCQPCHASRSQQLIPPQRSLRQHTASSGLQAGCTRTAPNPSRRRSDRCLRTRCRCSTARPWTVIALAQLPSRAALHLLRQLAVLSSRESGQASRAHRELAVRVRVARVRAFLMGTLLMGTLLLGILLLGTLLQGRGQGPVRMPICLRRWTFSIAAVAVRARGVAGRGGVSGR